MKRLTILALIGALAVAGCAGAGTQQNPGHAEKLHRHAPQSFKQHWQEYTRTPRPTYYALALDGSQANFTYCPAPTVCPDTGPAKFKTIQRCQSGITVKCDLYAIGRRIVWPHAFPWYVAPEVLYDHRESIGNPIDGQDRATLQ